MSGVNWESEPQASPTLYLMCTRGCQKALITFNGSELTFFAGSTTAISY